MTANVLVQGWLVEVSPTAAVPPAGAHELTHVVQQGGGLRAWTLPRPGATRSKVAAIRMDVITKKSGHASAFVPEVGDEVVLLFEHHDPTPVDVHFNPSEFTVTKSNPWKVELGPVRRAAFKAVVRRRGFGALGMSVLRRGDRWTKIL